MIIALDNIEKLEVGETLVIENNLAGRITNKFHLQCGAIYGQGTGRAGQTYSIATKDYDMKALPLEEIGVQIGVFLGYCRYRPDELFLVTPIGIGPDTLYMPVHIAPFFKNPPAHCAIPACFANLL